MTEDEPAQDWTDELRRAHGALVPTGSAGEAVRRGVARRRRRRAAVSAGGAAAVVAAALVGTALLPDADAGRAPAADESASTMPTAEPALFDCPTDHRVFTEEPPPIEDEARQQRTVDRISGLATREFSMKYAETSPLGVIALVEGDEGAAMRYLRPEGVDLVQPWDPSGPGVGLDEHAQVEQVIGWQIDPVIGEVERATRGIPGRAGLAYWHEAGAVVVQWKRPVPDEVSALEGQRPNGVRVIVEGATYSEKDVEEAQRSLGSALEAGRLSLARADRSMSTGCQDGSGLIVGVVPEALGERRAALQAELAQVVGMPVRVVPEERPVPLTERPER